MEFAIDERTEGAHRVVAVSGELDLHTAPQLSAALAPLAGAGGSVLIDLTAVTFMDSSGIAVVVHALASARASGAQLALVGPQPRVRKVLAITGVDGMLPVHDTLEAALGG